LLILIYRLVGNFNFLIFVVLKISFLILIFFLAGNLHFLNICCAGGVTVTAFILVVGKGH